MAVLELRNKEHLGIAQDAISRLNSESEKRFGRSVSLDVLAGISEHISENQRAVEGEVAELFQDEFALATLGVSCAGLMSLSIDLSDKSEDIFPSDWLVPSGVNPNFAIAHQLSHIANYGLAVQTLIGKGLDAQARSLLRVMTELSWIILAVVFDRELWSNYVSCSKEEEREFSQKHLSSKKLNGILSRLESQLSNKNDIEDRRRILLTFKSHREEIFSSYSNVVHHSFESVVLGSRVFSEDSDVLSVGVFGARDSASTSTIRNLNFTWWYFLSTLLAILEHVHEFKVKSPDQGVWLEGVSAGSVLQSLFLHIYKDE